MTDPEAPTEPVPTVSQPYTEIPERLVIVRPPHKESWHLEKHEGGITHEYDIVDWGFRVGFFLFGLVLGWLFAHAPH